MLERYAINEDRKNTSLLIKGEKNRPTYLEYAKELYPNKKDFSEFIPEDGVIFSATVTVPKDSTAMDAIKTAALENNVEIKETRGYIRGIGGLFEKDCGGASGWMYSVNGTLPNVSSDKYTLNSNDRIELHYTVNLGDVA